MKREKNITTNRQEPRTFGTTRTAKTSRENPDCQRKNSCCLCGSWLIILIALLTISCERRAFPSALLPPSPVPETQAVYADSETTDAEETGEDTIEEYVFPRRILVPYTKEYLSPGQETRIAVLLENGDYGDEALFEFAKEPGKNCIEAESVYNVAVIKAVREGEQYLRISHPKAQESRLILYDVLPPSPPAPPDIDVSESPLIVRKGETKPLQLMLRNGKTNDTQQFQFQVVENAYAIEVGQRGDTLYITGIAPGAGKIRIAHPSALRDYDVMVIVD